MTRRPAEPLYAVIFRNGALRSAEYVGGNAGRNVTLLVARRIATEWYPRPDVLRSFCSVVARPNDGGPDIVLVQGIA